jgi:hypothetical protein
MVEKLRRHDRAHHVSANVFRPGGTQAVPEEARHRVNSAGLELAAEDISFDHRASVPCRHTAGAHLVPDRAIARERAAGLIVFTGQGVAMALQRAADDNSDRGFRVAEQWVGDPDPLLKRAAVAAVCEPRLLRDRTFARRALQLVDRVTADLASLPTAQRREPSVRTLRQALGYGWSVAIAAEPVAGLALFRQWETLPDKDIAWILRENRKKARFTRAVAAEATAGN